MTVLMPDCNLEPGSETRVGHQARRSLESGDWEDSTLLSSGGSAVAIGCQAQLRLSLLREGKLEGVAS